MNNRDYLRELSNLELAKRLIEKDWCEDIKFTPTDKGDFIFNKNTKRKRSLITIYYTSDNEVYENYEKAVEHEVKWLSSNQHICSDCLYNNLDNNDKKTKCYECCRGGRDNYTQNTIRKEAGN